jgi:hypothetical protein
MKYADDVNLPQFPSDVACEAARIDLPTLKNWISRKPPAVFVAENERQQSGERAFYRFTFRRVMQIAIVAELVGLGIGPTDAAWMAATFTDSENSNQKRNAGELFRKNFTVLVVASTHISSLVNADAETAWRLLPKLSIMKSSNLTSQIIVNLNQIDARVRVSVGLPVLAREGVV